MTTMDTLDPTPTIGMLQTHSLALLVQRQIERMILVGEIKAGTRVNEAALSTQLGTSRGPVREAFRALEEAGLVRLTPNRGVFVRQISIAEADDIYAVRSALEELIGRILAQRITAQQLQAMHALLKQMEEAVAARDMGEYAALNFEFHDRLAQFTCNDKLIETYRRLVKELTLFRQQSLAREEILPVSLMEHRAIIETIAAGDAAAAGQALLAHVTSSRERMHATAPQTSADTGLKGYSEGI